MTVVVSNATCSSSNNDFNINDKLSAQIDVNIRHAKSTATNYDPFDTMRKMPAIYPATWDDGRLASGKSGANPYDCCSRW